MRCWRGVWILTCTAWLTGAGCARESQTAPPEPLPLPTEPTTELTDAPVEVPPAESGLSIKRGVMVLVKDHATFTPCGETAASWLLDETAEGLAQIFDAQMQGGAVRMFVEAYGERIPVDETNAEARAYPAMFVMEEVLHASVEAANLGCNAPAPNYIVAARGNEPFWSVEVGEHQITWRQPDDPNGIVLPAAPAQDAEGSVRYVASGDGHELELFLDAQPCRDTMAGDFFAYAARASFNGEEFTGCARVGR